MKGIAAPNPPRRHGLSVAAIIATTVLAQLAAACGGGSSPSSTSSTGSGGSSNAGGSTSSPSAVGYSRCIRSHGVPNWLDPTTDSQGKPSFFVHPDKDGFDPYSPQITTKMDQCQHVENPEVPAPLAVYLPPNGNGG